ncbi:energy-coupling factor ABC transporter ATP-binding protein [Ferrimonas senticii]|uniref:energy-coupling factor ABC transporter ATP-binding protein n=1 Tax=Ferrimonas senticii TaxID=394566 RepID=UPI00040D1C77|nr:energy-coupling factor ABC transporter ATP-binding protein [Ferrimonas senticii]
MTLITKQLQLDHHGRAIGPISLTLARGQWLLLAGGNGAGKTLLCQALAGWLPQLTPLPCAGELQFAEHNLLANAPVPLAVQLLQAAPQWSGCAFNVADEIAFGLANQQLPLAEIEARIDHSLTLCQCHHLAERHPAELSGGESQRVALACALAMQPQLLVLDQAFSRLTPAAHSELLSMLKQQSQQTQMTVIVAEMALQPTLPLVDQVLLLRAGQVVAQGTPCALLPQLLNQLNCSDAWQALARALAQMPQSPPWLPLSDPQLIRWFQEHPDAID